METYLIGIDTSKNFFQACGVDAQGSKTFERKLNRIQVKEYLQRHKRCIVAMEVGSGSHYFGRLFESYGHEVRLIPAAFVKPYVKSQKNDRADAEAIAEAALRPNMRFVPVKRVDQQDLQNLHRVRERLVGARTATINQLRGLLAEYGIVLPQGTSSLRGLLGKTLSDIETTLSSLANSMFLALQEELSSFDGRIEQLNKQIEAICKAHPICKRLEEIPGVGALTATAIIAAATAPQQFKNGRQFAAWIGLVPKQYSTGGKTVLHRISKRGNPYIRRLLVHGARSVLWRAEKKLDDRSLWMTSVKQRRGSNKACVALANKNARVIWVLLTNPEARFEPTFDRTIKRLAQVKQAA